MVYNVISQFSANMWVGLRVLALYLARYIEIQEITILCVPLLA